MRVFLYFVFLIPILITEEVYSQCNVSVNAGPDVTLCAAGEQAFLNGNVSGSNIINTLWTPFIGLSDPTSLNPSVFVTGTTTYTLSADVFDPDDNLIQNGGFESGLSGFTSDYVRGPGGIFGPLSVEGSYEVVTNSNDAHSNWDACTDNSGGGNMLAVNGATIPNEEVWCQNVPVTPGTDYVFGVWIASIFSVSPAILQFSINGTPLGAPFNASSVTCVWNQFNENWNSGGSSNARICIVNRNTAENGNDFAIDDLFFGEVCRQTDQVTVEVLDLQANIQPPPVLPCGATNTAIELNGSASTSGPNISYEWTTNNGTIVGGANSPRAEINGSGTYTLTVTFDDGNGQCSEMATVQVIQDTNLPSAVANVAGNITCNNLEVSISGAGSSQGAPYTYVWTTNDGIINTPPDNLNITVGAAGTYQLEVTNNINGCSNTVAVTVLEDFSFPNAVATTAGSLNCDDSVLQLSGVGSSIGSNFEYEWTTTDGEIVFGETTLNPTIAAEGTYQIEVTNTANGCTRTDNITVTGDFTPPLAIIAATEGLDCNTASLILNGAGSSDGDGFTYEWISTDGNIVSDATTLNPTIDAPGTYELVVTNSATACTASESITIAGELEIPIIELSPPDSLNCRNRTVTLNVSNSSTGSDLSYFWTTDIGSFTSLTDSLNPIVDAPGNYELLIINDRTGCSNSVSIEVIEDIETPTASAGEELQLDCEVGSVVLDGNNSSQGVEFVYEWTTQEGNILSGGNTLIPEIDFPGKYFLTVTNDRNGCVAIDSVLISQDADLPEVEVLVDGKLDCNTVSLELDASGSSIGPQFSFNWTTPDGNFVANQNSLMPTIGAPGTYTINILDNTNNCETSSSIIVEQDTTLPIVEAGETDTLNCIDTQIQLNPIGSSEGNDFQYEWTTPDGNFLSAPNESTPFIDAPGAYTLTITNLENGCVATDEVIILEDVELPIADAGAPFQLNCRNRVTTIGAPTSSIGPDFTYLWSTPQGNILSGNTELFIEVNGAGSYALLITNTMNGCTATDIVQISIDTILPIVDAGNMQTLNCINPMLELDARVVGQGDFTFRWTTTNGNILSENDILNPLIDAPGIYNLEVTNETTHCVNNDIVEIDQNMVFPTTEAGETDTLNCIDTQIQLNSTGSSVGVNFQYEWTTQDGNLVSNSNESAPLIDAPGTYALAITDLENGCVATDEVIILEDVELPIADAGTPFELNCRNRVTTIGAPASSIGPDFTYLWSTPQGNILSGNTELFIEVNGAGSYALLITNTMNGCTATDIVQISIDTILPIVDAGNMQTLNCINPMLELDARVVGQGDLTFRWTTTNGNILSENDILNPLIDAPGIYNLEVTNETTHCVNNDVVEIDQNIVFPVVDAGQTFELSCDITQITLNGTNSDNAANLDYLWTTRTGNILSGETSTQPIIDAPGVYLLTLTNRENGCFSIDSVEITEDAVLPIADAGPVRTLTCVDTILVLNGSNSDQSATITYQWTSVDGNILSGENTLSPRIDAPGNYELRVIDTQNNCEAVSNVLIEEDITLPVLSINETEELNCTATTVRIDALNSSQGNEFVYQWSSQNGNILNGESTLIPEVNSPGIYELIIRNNLNGCIQIGSIEVNQNIEIPVAIINTPQVLDCNNPSIILDGMNSSNGTEFVYTWISNDGGIINGVSSLNPEVNRPGTYELRILNTLNGCTENASVEVQEDVAPPDADAGSTMMLNCSIRTVILDGQNSSQGDAFSYQWTSSSGSSVLNGNTLMPTINAPGIYELQVINEANGCEATSTVEVLENVTLPVVQIQTPAQLTCVREVVTLNATGSDVGGIFLIDWSSTNGNILNGETTLIPSIDAPGTYTLSITNTSNECVHTSNVVVTQNIVPPVVNSGEDIELDCSGDAISLNGEATGSGQFSFSWQTEGGSILNGSNTANPSIAEPGIYTLTVIDLSNGCISSDVMEVSRNPVEYFEFSLENPNCLSPLGNIEFTEIQGGTGPFAFSIDGGNTFQQNPTFGNLGAGDYQLVIQDINGCDATNSARINEVIDFELFLEPQVELTFGDTYLINTQLNISDEEVAEVRWSPAEGLDCIDCLRPTAKPFASQAYQIEVIDKDGCIATGRISFLIDRRIGVYFPNVFSPNNDGRNDTFFPFADNGVIEKVNSFQIFNRWGEQVFTNFNFQPNDPAQGWDGVYRGQPLNAAVFVYFAEVELIDGTTQFFKGDVTLVK